MSETPILDRVQQFSCQRGVAPARRANQLLVNVRSAAIVIAAFVVFYKLPGAAARISGLWAPVPPVSLESLLALFLAGRISTLTHECGHLIGGLTMKYSFHRFVAWPVDAIRTDAGIRFRRMRFAFGGATYMRPTLPVTSRLRAAVLVGSGVAANLVLGASAFALLEAIRSHTGELTVRSPDPEIIAILMLRFIVAICTLQAFFSILPFRGRHSSDGARMLDILSNGERFFRFDAINRLGAQLEDGSTCAELDRNVVQRAAAVTDPSVETMVANSTAYANVANASVSEAGAFLERALEATRYATPSERRNLAAECVVYFGWYRHDLEAARAWSVIADLPKVPPLHALRAEAAIAYCEGRHADAVTNLKAALETDELRTSCSRRSLERSIEQWIGKIQTGAPKMREFAATPETDSSGAPSRSS